MHLALNNRIQVWVIRHPKERIAKCSLRHLHERQGFAFLKTAPKASFDLTGCLLLALDAPPLTARDAADLPLVILDSTWRLLSQLTNHLTGTPIRRSLPARIHTAYPRISKLTKDPPAGLASIEALYAARYILGDNDPSLLEGYYWQDAFLKQFTPTRL